MTFHTNNLKFVIEIESHAGVPTFRESKAVIAYTPDPCAEDELKIRGVQALPNGEKLDHKAWRFRPGRSPIEQLPNVRFLELVFEGGEYTGRLRHLDGVNTSVASLYRAILSESQIRFTVLIGDSELSVFDVKLRNRLHETEVAPHC